MTTKTYWLSLIIVIGLTITSCSSDSVDEELTNQTLKKSISFEAKLNGIPFKADEVTVTIDNNIIHIVAKRIENNQTIFLTVATTEGNHLKLGDSDENPNNNVAGFLVDSEGFVTSNVNATTGEVNFLVNNSKEQLFEGTFFFAASNVNNQYITVTEGKFKKD